MSTRRSIVYLFFIAVFLLSLSAPTARVFAGEVMVSGSSITVTTTADEYDAVSNGQCSLREAITAANTDAAYGGCIGGSGADIIMLEAGTYTLSIVGPFNDDNSRGDLDILADVSIIGAGSAETIVDGDLALDRVFDVLSPAVAHFESMKITNGAAPAWHISGDGEDGGGIRSSGDVTLIDVVLINNHAGNGMDESGVGGDGGGIYCTGTLTIIESLLQYNRAGNGGNTTSKPSTSGAGGNGGGIMALGDLAILDSTILLNYAGNSGNGVMIQQSYVGQGGSGGGIYSSGTTEVTHSEIRSNYGGNIGTGPVEYYSITGGNGGGIYNDGIITIITSTLSSNRPGNGFEYSPGNKITNAGTGGGLYNRSGATATIVGSGIHDNSGAYAGLNPRGGGIFNGGTLIIENTTIAKNKEPYQGGGIYNTSTGVITINASTIAYNESQFGGGIFNLTGGSVTFMNTILAHNVGWQGGYDCNGEITSSGYNLIINEAECTIVGDMSGVLLNVVPSISAKTKLDYYGGETKTLIPLTSSPVIDAGNPAAPGSGGSACPAVDQRGVTRPQAAACDIGAAEATPQFKVSMMVDEVFTLPGQLITFTITVENIGGQDALDATIYDDLPAGLIFAGPVVLAPAHPEAAVAVDAGDIPFVVTGLSLTSGGSVTVTLPVTTDVNYPGGEIITNTALAFTAMPQTEGSAYRTIQTGWRVMLPLILR